MKTDLKVRALSLDALRGYAIITMILSGQMLLTHLPAWMAHAQVPPGKGFDPTIYGITWVDLVFPFFLFAMGAAFPFSVGSKLAKGVSKLSVSWSAFIRSAQLVFFAIFFQHMKPWVIDSDSGIVSCLLALFSFALMFFMFMDINIPKLKDTKYASLGRWSIKIIAFAIALLLMNTISFTGKSKPEFDPAFSDIILIVLANVAFFGTVIYTLTYKKPIYRLAILPFVMAIFLAGKDNPDGGWVKELYEFTPLAWAYRFYYLKYLFIVIPGSIAGEYLHDWISNQKAKDVASPKGNPQALMLALLTLAIIVTNVALLYTRCLELNLAITIVLLVACHFVLKMDSSNFSAFWKRLFIAGAYCLLLGLVLEAYEGGIRKDSSTYSYYFVTSGLAFLGLIIFSVICDYFKSAKSTKFLVMTGQNPMLAYVTTSLVTMPILIMTHATNLFTVFEEGAFMGFLRGVIITAIAVLITMFFTRIKWFWRT